MIATTSLSQRKEEVGCLTPIVQVTDLWEALPKTRRIREVVRHPFGSEWKTVLQQINLDVYEGEVLGVIGANGAGKSTLLRVLCGLLIPTKGRVSVFGRDIGRDWESVKARIGYVPAGNPGLYERISGYQNLEFFGRLQGMYGQKLHQRIRECLNDVNLSSYGNEPVRCYSSGMKQRLSIARALLSKPDLILFDEPTTSLDPKAAIDVRFLIRDVCESQNCTSVIASHNLRELESVCDRVAILNHGKLLVAGTARQIAESHRELALRSYSLLLHGSVACVEQVLESLDLIDYSVSSGAGNGAVCLDITTTGADGSIDRLTSSLASASIEISSLTERPTTLEDVLLGVIYNDQEPQ